jgi:hypothetical protein
MWPNKSTPEDANNKCQTCSGTLMDGNNDNAPCLQFTATNLNHYGAGRATRGRDCLLVICGAWKYYAVGAAASRWVATAPTRRCTHAAAAAGRQAASATAVRSTATATSSTAVPTAAGTPAPPARPAPTLPRVDEAVFFLPMLGTVAHAHTCAALSNGQYASARA